MPSGYSNYNIRGGTLAALVGSFPAGATLLQIGNESSVKGTSGNNVAVERVTLDGGQVVGTALAALNLQNVNLGPGLMVYGFNEYGIKMDGTGAGYVHHSWLGEMPPYASAFGGSGTEEGAAHIEADQNLTATCISMENTQHDCYVEDVIIWSGLVGIRSQNGANQIQGVHTWNLMTTDGGIGILLEGGMGKVIDSYLDFTPLVIVDPKSVIVSNNLFLARGNLVLRSSDGAGLVQGLLVTSNRWWSENSYVNDTIVLDGNFTSVVGSTIEGNIADRKWNVKSTRATLTEQVLEGAFRVLIDFSKDLLFPEVPIQEAHCTLVSDIPVAHAIRPFRTGGTYDSGAELLTLDVVFAVPISGANVTCTVDQNSRQHAGH